MARVRAALPSGFDRELWTGLADLGAFSLRVPGLVPALVRVDGPVQDTILGEILKIKAITEAKLLRL